MTRRQTALPRCGDRRCKSGFRHRRRRARRRGLCRPRRDGAGAAGRPAEHLLGRRGLGPRRARRRRTAWRARPTRWSACASPAIRRRPRSRRSRAIPVSIRMRRKTEKLSIDLGLIETRGPLPQGFAAAPLADGAPALGEAVTVVGFGVAQEGGSPSHGAGAGGRYRRRRAALACDVVGEKDPAGAGLGGCHGGFRGTGGVPAAGRPGRGGGGLDKWGEGPGGCGAITQGPLVAPALKWIAGVGAGRGE